MIKRRGGRQREGRGGRKSKREKWGGEDLVADSVPGDSRPSLRIRSMCSHRTFKVSSRVGTRSMCIRESSLWLQRGGCVCSGRRFGRLLWKSRKEMMLAWLRVMTGGCREAERITGFGDEERRELSPFTAFSLTSLVIAYYIVLKLPVYSSAFRCGPGFSNAVNTSHRWL